MNFKGSDKRFNKLIDANIAKNANFQCFWHFWGGFGCLTPKLWVPLNLAHQDASFGTL
jgi:hypothetical protein